MTTFTFERPSVERTKLTSMEAVMDSYPDVVLVVDSKEQRIRRPSGPEDEETSTDPVAPPSPDSSLLPETLPLHQKPYYSGKKKAPALKTQIAVRPEGRIEAVSESVPGSFHDLTLLRKTQLLDRLEPDEAAMFDKGSVGISKDFPDRDRYLPFKARRNRRLAPWEQTYNAFLASYRILVEPTNAQLQKFQAWAQVYRHDRRKHARTVRAVAGLVSRQIARQPLKVYGLE